MTVGGDSFAAMFGIGQIRHSGWLGSYTRRGYQQGRLHCTKRGRELRKTRVQRRRFEKTKKRASGEDGEQQGIRCLIR